MRAFLSPSLSSELHCQSPEHSNSLCKGFLWGGLAGGQGQFSHGTSVSPQITSAVNELREKEQSVTHGGPHPSAQECVSVPAFVVSSHLNYVIGTLCADVPHCPGSAHLIFGPIFYLQTCLVTWTLSWSQLYLLLCFSFVTDCCCQPSLPVGLPCKATCSFSYLTIIIDRFHLLTKK